MRVSVKPELLEWACIRAGLDDEDVTDRIPQFPSWKRGENQPTLKQIEGFANVVHAPVGYFFLDTPPVEKIPIPDFRTIGNDHIEIPSPDLLESIYICQQRQEWYRDFARSMGEESLPFIGSVSLKSDIEETASNISRALGFDLEERRKMPTWEEALRRFIDQADELGVLVMVNGVVGSNNRRKLDPEEFRGFALSDDLAPLIFINGADSKSAQMFTLAHELAHLWIGMSALSDVGPSSVPSHKVEMWCNLVAAEILVPITDFKQEYRKAQNLQTEVARLAKRYKVSTLVILRRIFDSGNMSQNQFWQAYDAELSRLMSIPKGSGGNFYFTQAARVSKRFARALVANTLEGHTLHRDAFRLLGFSKLSTFRELGHSLGVA